MWMQAVGLGLSVLGGMAQGKAAEVQQRVQAANAYQQTLINYERELKGIQAGLEQQRKQNDAIAKADLQSLINANFTAGLLNLQRSMQKRQTAADIARLGETKLQALASAEVASAASGTIGASVNAVAADIKMKVGEAILEQRDQNDMNTLNHQTNLYQLYQNFLDTQQEIDTSTPDIPGMPPKYGAVTASAGQYGLAAGINYMGDYLMRRMSLGGGGGGLEIGSGLLGSLSQTLGSSSNFTPSVSFKL